jgi:hypothetical protein
MERRLRRSTNPVGIRCWCSTRRDRVAVFGVNGLVGNLGIARAAVMTGFAREVRRMAHGVRRVPGLISIALGICFWRVVAAGNRAARAPRAQAIRSLPRSELVKAVLVLTVDLRRAQPRLQLHDQRNGELMDGPLAQRDRRSGGHRRVARPRVRSSRSFSAAHRRPRDRPLSPEALFRHRAHADSVVPAGGARERLAFYAMAIAFMAFVFGAFRSPTR